MVSNVSSVFKLRAQKNKIECELKSYFSLREKKSVFQNFALNISKENLEYFQYAVNSRNFSKEFCIRGNPLHSQYTRAGYEYSLWYKDGADLSQLYGHFEAIKNACLENRSADIFFLVK